MDELKIQAEALAAIRRKYGNPNQTGSRVMDKAYDFAEQIMTILETSKKPGQDMVDGAFNSVAMVTAAGMISGCIAAMLSDGQGDIARSTLLRAFDENKRLASEHLEDGPFKDHSSPTSQQDGRVVIGDLSPDHVFFV